MKISQRNLQIVSLYARGATREYIAAKLHIERERITDALTAVCNQLFCDKSEVVDKLVEIDALTEDLKVNYDYLYPKLEE